MTREVASASRKRKPKPLKWRLEWLAQTGVEKLAAVLPGPMAYRLGSKLGGLAWYFMRSRRQIVLRNLRIALQGEHDLPTLRKMVRENFRRTGANLLSALHSSNLSPEEVDRIVTVTNPELLVEALGRCPGVVTMPSHMGNWEILTRIGKKFPPGHPMGAFYRPLNNPLLDARVLEQREKHGVRLFSKKDSFHQGAAYLREKAIIGILADQRVGMAGEVVPFFGRLTRASPLPSLMARRARCETLGMGVIADKPGKWIIRYEAVQGKLGTASSMEAVERVMRVSPLDVFWFQERWKVYIRPDHTIRDWLGDDGQTGAKPHRALLWLPGTPGGWTLPEAWTHPDVKYEVVEMKAMPAPRNPRCLYAKFHCAPELPEQKKQQTLLDFLTKTDESEALPIDYILTCNASSALKMAAESLSIPLVSLDPPLP